ncbi:DUF1499 domain-containing protein [Frigidibacter sp. SD6-1]|uniref:DUF1499 domain-containing protein n=1 Tax=Frigidibacter sp. SD6-1 TaxID=3032581 RepID=UPI0032E80054
MLYALLLILAGGMAWIRLAPDDPGRWHVDPAGRDREFGIDVVRDGPGGVIAVAGGARARTVFLDETAIDVLARLDAIAMATPRTRRLAGSPAEGRITWVTRSAFFGFPDYTTADAQDGPVVTVEVFARLRYGGNDFRVNFGRLRDWLTRLGAE